MRRIALFGCGRIGTMHAESVAAHPGAELAWVGDPMEGPATELAGKHGARATADVATLVAPSIAEAGDIGSAVVVLRAANGAHAHITTSRRADFGYDQRIEAFGSSGMLSAENQRPTSVGTPTAPSFADGRAALVLADAANESLRTGRGVRV